MKLSKYINLMQEWDYDKNTVNPNEMEDNSSKKAFWICKLGHSFQTVINKRTTRKDGCPYCSNQKVLTGFNDFATKYPSLIEFYSDKNKEDIHKISANNQRKFIYKCKVGHEIITTPKATLKGCPICRNKVFIKNVNDLATTHKELIETEWDYETNTIDPTTITKGNKNKANWICKKGHKFSAQICYYVKYQICPYCNGSIVIQGATDLATKLPNIAKEWNYERNTLNPTEVFPNSHQKVWWKCKLNHEWESTIVNRTSCGNNCPYCSGQKTLTGFNDFATKHPEQLDRWDYNKNEVSPTEISACSKVKYFWWTCEKKHSYYATTNDILKSGCPICSNRKIVKGINDLATKFPYIAKEWSEKNKLKATEIGSGSHIKGIWNCPLGHEYSMQVYKRTGKEHRKCPKCHDNSSSFTEQIVLYFIKKYVSSDIKHRYKYNGNEIDIYIENLNIGVEYNGEYWHKDTHEKDLTKELYLSHYMKMFYILESDENKILNNKIFYKEGNEESFEWAIEELLKFLHVNIKINIEDNMQQIYEEFTFRLVKNSLASTHPDLTKEWLQEKNGNLTPLMVVKGSEKKVWWKCTYCGNEWQTMVATRTTVGCPICKKRKKVH